MSNYRRWQARWAYFRGTSEQKPFAVGSGYRSSKKKKTQRKKDRKRVGLLARGILKLNPLFFGKRKKAKEQKGDKV